MTAMTAAATLLPRPLWAVARSSHRTYDCATCDTVAQAAADRLSAGAKRVTLTEEHADGTHRVTVERVNREINVSSLSPVKPADLTDAERERLQLVKPETIVMLTELPDGGYDLRGNGAVICGMCFEVFIGNPGAVRALKQRHLSMQHDMHTALLPNNRDHAVVA